MVALRVGPTLLMLLVAATAASAQPAAPGRPTVSVTVSGNEVTASWQPGPGGAVAGYFVRVQSGGGVDVFASPVGNVTSGSGVLPNGEYVIAVTATNQSGSTISELVRFVVGGGAPCTTAPPAPVWNQVLRGTTIVLLSWLPAPGAVSYVLQVDLGGTTVFNQNVGAMTSVSGVAPNGNYVVYVSAVNACGVGEPTIRAFVLQ